MSVIEEIKQKIDIVDLVSEHVSLHKAGHNFKAICPFHSEKDPSFFVFPDRQSWKCFGSCSTGGDIFAFVMKKESMEFGDALRLLAERAGVTLLSSPRIEAEREEFSRLRQINLAASQFYHNFLINTREGKPIIQYLTGRGVNQACIESFQLGFSPGEWESLLTYLKERGFTEKEIIMSGLAIQRDTGGAYDRFRSRLMFPIRDSRGNTVGFGGRATDDSMPKYMNSPQTPIFDKSGILYGLDRAAPAIRKAGQAILVEGYMDAIMAHQYGSENVVATMGTSLSEKHVLSLKKLTGTIVLALDADAAGEAAVLRDSEVAKGAFGETLAPVATWRGVIQENVLAGEIKVAILPPGKDPDELIRQSTEDWKRVINEARPLVDHIFDVVCKRHDISSATGKSRIVEELKEPINQIKDPVKKLHYIQKLAGLVRVEVNSLAAIINKKEAAFMKTTRFGKAGTSRELIKPLPRLKISKPIEEFCLAMVIQLPGSADLGEEIKAEYFENSENRVIFENWLDEPDTEKLKKRLDVSLHDHFEYLSKIKFPFTDEPGKQKALKDCILRLRENYFKDLKYREGILLSNLNNKDDATKVLADGIALNVKLKELFTEKKATTRHQRGTIENGKG
ncbi:MAG: DNA primase [Dehalococcoidia bacterium]|nr:DNA primase [Dehalococcoidia bacterium]